MHIVVRLICECVLLGCCVCVMGFDGRCLMRRGVGGMRGRVCMLRGEVAADVDWGLSGVRVGSGRQIC